MAASAILDQFGRPIQRKASKALTEQVRLRRSNPLSARTTMSAETLASTLRAADDGDIEAYLELATEMEERDLHYFGQLSTRKLALIGKPVQALPRDKSAKAAEVAEAFKETVLEDDTFPGLVSDLMDAMGKGFSVVQCMWDTSRPLWAFEAFEHIPTESFAYPPNVLGSASQRPLEDTDLHLILQDGKYKALTDLKGLYLMHKPKVRTGPTIRGGYARLAARVFLIKNYTVKEWLAFAEVYGMPLRYATYDPETITDEEKTTLAIALANLGTDASALIPRSAELEILGNAARTGQGASFDLLCRYLDEQLSKAILGQTMTADNGSSQSQANVHNEVRIDYLRFDALQLQLTLRHLARAWTEVNYGDASLAPRIRFAVEPPADLTSWTEAVLPWVTAGLPVSKKQVLDKLDLSEPEDESDTIKLIMPEPPGGGDNADGPPGKKKPGKSTNRRSRTDALSGWDKLMQPHVDELERIAGEAGDYESFIERLQLEPSSPLIDRLINEALSAREQGEQNGPHA